MAYAQGKTRSEKLASAGIVTAIHIGIGTLLAVTFGGQIVQTFTDHGTVGVEVKIDPVAEPSPTPAPSTTTRSVIDTPTSPITFAPADPIEQIIPPATGGEVIHTVITPTTPAADPVPTPTATFTPRAARPRTSPTTWATALDYPWRAIREGRQGVTAFRVTVGTDGKVTNCMIIRSSGSQDLDATTCAKVSRRATFEPATDDAGNVVTGSYANSIRWELPE